MRGAVFGAHLAAISVARIGLTERISHAESLMLRIVLSSLLTAVLLAAASSLIIHELFSPFASGP